MKSSIPLLLISALLIFECSSGKKQLERGEYYDAVVKSVNRLKSNSDHKKSKETLQNAYPLAVEVLTESAIQGISTNEVNKWRNAVVQYQKLHNMYDLIKKTPGARAIISNAESYYGELSEAKNNAANESYSLGVVFLNKQNREYAKTAYYHFQDALTYVANYKDASNLMEKSLFEATIKVVVEQIPVLTQEKLSADFFQDKVEEFFQSTRAGSQFVAFYSPTEVAEKSLPYIDQILRIQFDHFLVGQEFISIETETFEKDSVEVGEVALEDGTKKPILGTVKAKLSIYSKTIKSEGLVSMLILKSDGNTVIKHEKFRGSYIWKEQWASFNGDERALTNNQLKLCERKEFYAPLPQDMFIRFTEPIYNQLTNEISQFYSNY